MLQEIETQTLTVTSSAAQAVKDVLAQRNLEGYALRVYVAGGGCCGVNFGMALDNNFNEVDTVIDTNGVKVVVDNTSLDYLRGATVDFVNDPTHGAGFLVDSPNAKQGHGEDKEGCECGGSCSCNSNN